MQTESTLLVFKKVPTKGFKLDAVGTHIRRAKIPGGWLVVLRDTVGHHIRPRPEARMGRRVGGVELACLANSPPFVRWRFRRSISRQTQFCGPMGSRWATLVIIR